jgi:hypothetical protein
MHISAYVAMTCTDMLLQPTVLQLARTRYEAHTLTMHTLLYYTATLYYYTMLCNNRRS